jgi:hypothetical protein
MGDYPRTRAVSEKSREKGPVTLDSHIVPKLRNRTPGTAISIALPVTRCHREDPWKMVALAEDVAGVPRENGTGVG